MSLLGRLLKRETPAPERTQPEFGLDDIPSAWDDGGWAPNWSIIQTWLDQNKPFEQHGQAWWALTGSWLSNLAADLGAPYACYATENFRILCPYDQAKAKPHLDFLEDARKRLADSLGLRAALDNTRPVVVIIFYDREEYLAYLSTFREMEPNDSCGAFFRGGYPHIALHDDEKLRMQITLTREMTSNLIAHLPLPLWLSAGLARLSSAELGLGLVFNQMKEIRLAEDPIRECWQRNGLLQFWSGSAFSLPDQRQKRAYQLSEILTRTLLVDAKARVNFAAFVAAAHQDDGGEAAALQHLGASLGHWAGEFLGPGEWAPRRNDPPAQPAHKVPGVKLIGQALSGMSAP